MGQLIGASELGWMRGVQESAMPESVVVERRTDVSDGMGGYRESWGAVGTVAGRLRAQEDDGTEGLVGEEVGAVVRWWLEVPTGTGVTVRDRVVVDGGSFEVVRVLTAESWETCERAEVMSVNGERRV